MNDMVERYLQAIRVWLPEKQRNDILAEISEDVESQIAEQRASLGRPLTGSEIEALLQTRARPMLVANGYRTQQALIGPLWFPMYAVALKVVAGFYLLPWALVSFVIRRVQHPELSWGQSVFAAGSSLVTAAFVVAGMITLVFAFLQWSNACTGFLERWQPRQLPPLRKTDAVTKGTGLAEVALHGAFLLAWIVYARSPLLVNTAAFRLMLAPGWNVYFFGFLSIGVANLAVAAYLLWSRHWNRVTAVCRLLIDLSGGALFCFLLRAHLIVTLYSTHLGPDRSAALKSDVYLWVDRCFPIAVIVTAIALTIDIVRVWRVSRAESFPPAKAVAVLIAALLCTTATRVEPTLVEPAASPSVLAHAG